MGKRDNGKKESNKEEGGVERRREQHGEGHVVLLIGSDGQTWALHVQSWTTTLSQAMGRQMKTKKAARCRFS